MKIPWESLSQVPISEAKKLQWAQECLDFLNKNPDELMTFISSGDTIIMVQRVNEDLFSIEELKPQRRALYDQSLKVDLANSCCCSTTNLMKKGCQCGGN